MDRQEQGIKRRHSPDRSPGSYQRLRVSNSQPTHEHYEGQTGQNMESSVGCPQTSKPQPLMALSLFDSEVSWEKSECGNQVKLGNTTGVGEGPVKLTAQPRDPMSTAEMIQSYSVFLKNWGMKVNIIQTMENGLTSSKLNLKSEYEVEQVSHAGSPVMFSGRLALSGVFLSRTFGATKKEVKHHTYQKAYALLTSKSVTEILSLVDPGIRAISTKLDTCEKDVNLMTSSEEPEPANTADQEAIEIDAPCTSVELGFITLIQYLKDHVTLLPEVPGQRISFMEKAILESQCGLTRQYDSQEMRGATGMFFFRGIFTIGDIVVARSEEEKLKREAKYKTYDEAYKRLTTMPINEIMQHVRNKTNIVDPWTAETSPTVKEPQTSDSLKDRIEKLIQSLKENEQGKNRLLQTLDVSAVNAGIKSTSVFQQVKTAFNNQLWFCRLYFDNVLITSGKAERKKESRIEAYDKAWDRLCASTAQNILDQSERINPDEDRESIIKDVGAADKSTGKFGESNLAGLRMYKLDPNDEENTVESLVIMEHADWANERYGHAFCILNYSATHNRMLLEWLTEREGTEFRCEIRLQKQTIGQAASFCKKTAKNMAAGDALFKFYETQDVILIARRDDSKLWISWEDLEEKAEQLKKETAESSEVVDAPVAIATSSVTTASVSEISTSVVMSETDIKSEASASITTDPLEINISMSTKSGSTTPRSATESVCEKTVTEVTGPVNCETDPMLSTPSIGELMGSVTMPTELVGAPGPITTSHITMETATYEQAKDSQHPIFRWIIRATKKLIHTFSQQNTLDELIFAPGISLLDRKEFRQIARRLHMKREARQHEGRSYLVYVKQLTPQKMSKCLTDNGGKSGKFMLVSRDQLPTHEVFDAKRRRELMASGGEGEKGEGGKDV